MKKSLLSFALVISTLPIMAAKINFTLSFPEAQAHYVSVKMDISDIAQDELELKMPVWAPGSYLVREYARQVEALEAVSGTNTLSAKKTNKNTWKITTKGLNSITVNYKVYAYELTVRTSFIDADHAYLNGSSIFLYPKDGLNTASTIKIVPSAKWKICSNPLDKINDSEWERKADNFDMLFDSPWEIGNQDVISFTAAGIPHTIAMYNGSAKPVYDKEKLIKDFTKIIDMEAGIFGPHPCKNYTFIVHNLGAGGGGLEHLNSTTLQTSRLNYTIEASYQSFLSLVAHEYFHLWNVKRLRPEALGPFDYDTENYTTMLWVSEGFTAFYDDWITRRTGTYSSEKYLGILADNISLLENTPGSKVQSASESSFDAWIKYYRRTENSNNSTISYYDKGGQIACFLNLSILQNTKGKYTLDEVMKQAYDKFYIKRSTGFTELEFKAVLENVSGLNLDDFFKNSINGTVTPDYNMYFGYAGLKLTDNNAGKNDVFLGATTTTAGGKVTINQVVKGGSAYTAGLNVNDEIIAIDGYRTDDVNKVLSNRKVGDSIVVLISRDGLIQSVNVTLSKNNNVKYKVEKIAEPSALQKKIYAAWVGNN